MAEFSVNIQNFQRYGIYIYKPDDVGNFIFNSSSADFSRAYFAFPLQNFLYNDDKIASFYDVNFTEFAPTIPATPISSVVVNTDEMQQQLDVVTQENTELKSQLDLLISQTNTFQQDSQDLANKQVILELRKSLGQGRVNSDFSEDFPYAPVRKEKP